MPALISSGQLFNTHVERIEDVINKNIDIMLPGVDPIWENMVTSSMGVGPVDALGREYKILKVFMGGLTGIFEQGRSRNDFALFGDATDETFGDRLFQQQVTQSFPDALDGMNQKPYRFGLPMRTMVANIAFTLGELQAEASPAFIGQIVAPKLEGFSRNIAQTLCNSWYTSQNDGYVLSSVTSKSASGSGPYYLEFEPSTDSWSASNSTSTKTHRAPLSAKPVVMSLAAFDKWWLWISLTKSPTPCVSSPTWMHSLA